MPANVIEYDSTYRLQWGWQQSSAPQEQGNDTAESFFDLLPTMDPWEWQLLFDDVELLCNEHVLWERSHSKIAPSLRMVPHHMERVPLHG